MAGPRGSATRSISRPCGSRRSGQLNRPQPANPTAGRAAFDANCASCHGGAKWTKSQTIYLNNPTFDRNPTVAGAVKFDPFLSNVGLELVSYSVGGAFLSLLDPVGTFDATNPREVRNNGNIALGARGFKAVSLNGIGHAAPYFHDGSAATLDDVFARHLLPGGGTIAARLPGDLADLKSLLDSIDGGTTTFESDTDKIPRRPGALTAPRRRRPCLLRGRRRPPTSGRRRHRS